MKSWIMLLLVTSFLNATEKIALLIGNDDYSFQPLNNPLNDVDGIYKTLIEIGFKESNIKVLKNASKTKMERELANFSQRATSAEIALVYFSGHGIQVNNKNYMFPARTTATKPIHLRTLVDLDYFIESASSAKYGIILVDACRNNPLGKYFQNEEYNNSRQKMMKGKKGLGQINIKQIKGDFIIGFATSAGNTADDGVNSINSPYAESLIKRLKLNLEIRKVLGEVGKDVNKKYPYQNPIVKFTLGKTNVCLTGKCEEGNSQFEIINNLKYQNEPFIQKYTWGEATEHCNNLVLEGYENWKLPTIEEYNFLLTKNGKIRDEFISNISKDDMFFWSFKEEKITQKKVEKATGNAFAFYFTTGDKLVYNKYDYYYALCVHN